MENSFTAGKLIGLVLVRANPIQSTLDHTVQDILNYKHDQKRLINQHQNSTIGYWLFTGMDSSPISYWCSHEDVRDILFSYTAYSILWVLKI